MECSKVITVLILFFLFYLIFYGCSDHKRNNPADHGSENYSPVIKYYLINNDYDNTGIIEVLDPNNNYLWSYSVNSKIIKAEIVDINQSGNEELIFITSNIGKDAGKVFLISNLGKKISEYNSKIKDPYSGGLRSENFTIKDFAVENIYEISDKYLIVIAHDTGWYPGRLFLLDKNLSLVSNYWNPGFILNLYIADVYEKKKVIISGYNNDLAADLFGIRTNSVSFIALFDAEKISGLAPPRPQNSEKGTENWYGFFYPPSPEVYISKIEFTNNISDSIKEITIWTNVGYIYSLQSNGEPSMIAEAYGAKKKPDYYLIRNDTLYHNFMSSRIPSINVPNR